MNPEIIAEFPMAWIAAWNDHDLEKILSHYADDVEFRSPFVARLQGNPTGALNGKVALRPYFQAALQRFPDLKFELRNVFMGTNSVVIEYQSVENLLAAETIVLNPQGQAAQVFCHYRSWDANS